MRPIHDAPTGSGAVHDFTWIDGERLVRFATGAAGEAAALAAGRGFDGYVLLTTERAASSQPELAAAASDVAHVPLGPVPEAAAAVRDRVGGRPIVALGGGRVIDSAKAIAGADGLRCAAVPTTLSGAEMTPFHRMPAGVDDFRFVRPALVVADPELMASQPAPQLAASAMNALGHAMEALYTPLASPVSELAALRATELLASGLTGRDEPSRDEVALGSLLAGYAVGAAGFAVHHAACQTLVRVAGTPHAETNAVMLPHFARAMAPRAPRVMGALARALGADSDDPGAAAERIAALAAGAGATTLSELGVEREQLDELVEAALAHPAIGNTPDPIGAHELRRLLAAAL